MADFRPLLWDPAGPVKRRFAATDTLELDTDGTNSIFDLKISATSVLSLNNSGVLVQAPSGSTTNFQHFDGARAAGIAGNINTDSALGETLRVGVDNGAGGFNTRWIPALIDEDLDNLLTGNNLDEAYNAFSGAGTVTIDAGDLKWALPIAATFYDVHWTDANDDDFLATDSTNDALILGATGGTNERYVSFGGKVKTDIAFDGTAQALSNAGAQLQLLTTTSGEIDITSAGAVDINSGSTVTMDAASGSAMTLTTSGSGSLFLKSAAQIDLTTTGSAGGVGIDINSTGNGEININTTDSNANFTVGGTTNNILKINTSGATGNNDIQIQTASTSGTLDIDVGNWEINSTGGATCFINSGGNLNITSDASSTYTVNGDYYLYINSSSPYREIITMKNNESEGVGLTDATTQFLISSNSPVTGESAGTAALRGSLCLETTSGSAWIKTGAGATEWEALAFAGGVPTWDEIYTNDKTFEIDSTPLVITQTSTANAIQITRDEATTTGAMVSLSTTNASDDYAALEVYTSSIVAPAVLFGMIGSPTAQTGVVASALITAGAVGASSDASVYTGVIYPNSGDPGAAIYRGYYAVGSATGSANKYGFSADAAWDYGLHSLAPVHIEQSSTSGYALYVTRNLAAASTDSPVAQIYNQGADDWPCLKAHSDIADTITSDVVHAVAEASAIKTSGITSVFRAEITPHASDAGGAYYGFHADGSTDGGAESKVGYYADADWYLGVYSLSPGRFKYTTTASITSGVLAAQTTVPAAAAHDMVGVSSTISVGAAASGGLIAYAAETSSAGTSGPVVGYKADMTAHTNDTSTYTGFQALLGGTTSGLSFSYGFGADNSWGYGVYSESPVATALSISAAATANYIEVTSAGVGGGATVDLLKLLYVEDSTDAATVNGIKIELTPDPGANTKNGVLVDDNWTYGLYSSSPGYINRSALAASDDGFSVIATSGGISTGAQIVNLIDLSFTEHSGDSGSPKVNGINIALTPDGSSTAATTGIKIDSDWDLGISSQSPGNFSRTSLTDDYDALAISISSGGLGSTPPKTVQLIDLAFAEHTDDRIANIFGINIALTPEALATNDKRAINVDDNWSYGFYSQSIVEVNLTKSDNNPWTLATLDFNSGGRAGGPSTVGLLIDFDSHTSDTGDYTGIDLNYDGDATVPGNVIAIDVSTAWDYGLYSRSNVFVKETGLTKTNSSLSVDLTSGGITSGAIALYGIEVSATTHVSDSAGNISGVRVNDITYLGALTSSRGVSVGSGWDYGVYSRSQITAITGPSAGTGSLEYWATESHIAAPSAGLSSNDEVAAYKATITDDSDDGGAFYYGLYITTADAGPATKWGIHVDTTWPADQYVMRIRSGLWYAEEDFGTITGNTDHIYTTLSGLLNSSNEGRALNLNVTPDVSQAADSTWIGVRANMTNVNANDTVGSFAFYANDNWHYGFYADNDLSKQQAPRSTGCVHVESTSSSLVASGSYYGYDFYHTRHVSDSGGTLKCFYAQASGAGDLEVRAFEAGNLCDVGFYSAAPTNLFTRADGASTTTDPTLTIENLDNDASGGTAPALKVKNAYTAATGIAFEIDHAYDGSSTEDTRRAIVFTSAQTNKRQIPVSTFMGNMTNTTTSYWYFICTSTSQRWRTSGTAARSMSIPLMVPHNSVIKSVDVQCYHQNTCVVACQVDLMAHSSGGATSNSQGSQAGSTASGTQTVTLSGLSVAVDNTTKDYYIKYINGTTSGTSESLIYTAHVTYEITDFAAACGF